MQLRCTAQKRGCSDCALDALALQFGGAAGTLAALGDNGLKVAEALARRSWTCRCPMRSMAHPSRPHRRNRLGAGDSLAGTCGKIARDVSLMMQTDVGEAFEPAGEGRGGSSTMPHKRNPVASAIALSAATMAPNLAATIFAAQVQEHERSAGPWHAEWPTLADAVAGDIRADSPPSSISPKGWKSTPTACASISTRPTA